jgi:hypothetical protein
VPAFENHLHPSVEARTVVEGHALLGNETAMLGIAAES